jgi:4-amino-4-deoxy-L-arabinose transferase-like glycosyltransferase
MSAGEQTRWAGALLGICLLALGIRIGYVLGWRDVPIFGGDAGYYHDGANLLAHGHGFAHPDVWRETGEIIPGADHPPAYIVVLAFASLLGFDSIRAHMLTSCLIGAGTVALIGLLGRRVGGKRIGLLAAAVAAVYPNMWMNDGALMSETLDVFLAVMVSILAYRVWDRPTAGRWAAMGASIGLAALARAESVLMLVLLLVPLALWVRGLSGWQQRARRAGLAFGVALLVVAPWVGANLVRFEHPEGLSTQAGVTLLVANCDDAYHGTNLGWWAASCIPDLGDTDRSVTDLRARSAALHYAHGHMRRLPVVVAARVGRTWGLYAPHQQLMFDKFSEGRVLGPAEVGLAMYYVLAALAVPGLVALRRRRTPVFPLTVWMVSVMVTVVVFYGTTRFRAPAEPALVLLATVGLVAVLDSARARVRTAEAGAATTTAEPEFTPTAL